MREEPGGGLATQCETSSGLRLGQAARAMGVAAEQVREPLGEGAAWATRIAAVEASNRQPQPNDLAARRQICGLSPIAAMDCRAERSASWAAGLVALAFGRNAQDAGASPGDVKQTAAGQRTEQGHALICESMPAVASRPPSCCLIHQTR
jgi:hypothetical protein